jgi:hypothetical protein
LVLSGISMSLPHWNKGLASISFETTHRFRDCPDMGAERMSLDSDRAMMLEMAETWLELARRTESEQT